YLTKHYGSDFADTVLRGMEMPESALKFKDKDISILTFKTLHRKAIALAQDKMLPFELGRHNRFNQSNIAMVRQLVPPCSHIEFYQLMCEEISAKMDQNFFYRVTEVSDNAVKINACTRAERLEA